MTCLEEMWLSVTAELTNYVKYVLPQYGYIYLEGFTAIDSDTLSYSLAKKMEPILGMLTARVRMYACQQ